MTYCTKKNAVRPHVSRLRNLWPWATSVWPALAIFLSATGYASPLFLDSFTEPVNPYATGTDAWWSDHEMAYPSWIAPQSSQSSGTPIPVTLSQPFSQPAISSDRFPDTGRTPYELSKSRPRMVTLLPPQLIRSVDTSVAPDRMASTGRRGNQTMTKCPIGEAVPYSQSPEIAGNDPIPRQAPGIVLPHNFIRHLNPALPPAANSRR